MARRFLASGPSARKISETSNSAVGHTSGQWVKPKNTRNGWPLKSWSVIVLPFWSVSRNGPPIAEGAAMIGAPPRSVTSRTTEKHRISPATKAERTSSRRVVRGFISKLSLGLETRRDAGRDDLEEHRRAVVRPQPQRCDD